jgi:hypothetical protein
MRRIGDRAQTAAERQARRLARQERAVVAARDALAELLLSATTLPEAREHAQAALTALAAFGWHRQGAPGG